MAETLTDKLKLSKRDTGDLNWGQGANANLDAIDAHAQQATLRPPRTLAATLGSGAVGANLLGSTTYFYKVTAVNAAGETTEGKVPSTVEAQVTQPATPLPVILQWETVKGATGYKIYKATASGQEKFLASVSGEATSTYTDDGNTATNPAISVPTTNTARTSVSKIVAGSNVTVSPPDGTGEVTINAASGTSPDASATVKGVSKLSIAPAVATDPIAVGDNDPRNTNARTPTGAAGGDLSGTYPNPTVADVDGATGTLAAKQKVEVQKAGVVQGTRPAVNLIEGAGIALTVADDAGNNRVNVTVAASGGGGGGYATVVVAAPTGVAATDTANIQNAVNGLPASGGSVVLREGTYRINTQIVLPAAKPVWIIGQGRGTVLLADGLTAGLSGFKGPATGNLEKIVISDLVWDGGTPLDVRLIRLDPGTGQTFSDIVIQRVLAKGAARIVACITVAGALLKNLSVLDCVGDNISGLVHVDGPAGTVEAVQIERNAFTATNTGFTDPGIHIVGRNNKVVGNRISIAGVTTGITTNLNGLEKSTIRGNVMTMPGLAGSGGRGISIATNGFMRNCVIADNFVDSFGTGIDFAGEVSNCIVAGNRSLTGIVLAANAASSGNVVAANNAAVTDNSGQSNTIVQNYVTGVRKLGEASPLTGDVKLEGGTDISLTQDAPGMYVFSDFGNF